MNSLLDPVLGIIGICLLVFIVGGIIRLAVVGFNRLSQTKRFRWLSKL